jgi:hypothetical protein
MSFKEQWEETPVKKSPVERLDDYIKALDEGERKIALAFISKAADGAAAAFRKEGYPVGERTIRSWKAQNGVQ